MLCKTLGLSQPFADVVLHYTFLLLCLPTNDINSLSALEMKSHALETLFQKLVSQLL